jgi:hypothetical protein
VYAKRKNLQCYLDDFDVKYVLIAVTLGYLDVEQMLKYVDRTSPVGPYRMEVA